MSRQARPYMHAIMTHQGLVHKGFHIRLLSVMDVHKQKFWLYQEQPNLVYADDNLNIACMQGEGFSKCILRYLCFN